MVKALCQICHECFRLENFRFLRCGHGFCTGCTEKTASNTTCPICRVPKMRHDPQQIYVNFVESNLEKASSVVHGLSKIDENSPAISVERASRKIQEVVKNVEAEKEVASELLEVAKGLEDRIFPVYAKLEEQSKEIVELNKTIAELRRKSNLAKSFDAEAARLRPQLREAKSLAEQARERAIREIDENLKLTRSVKRQRTIIEEREEENKQLKASLDRRDKEVGLLKRRLRALTKQIKPVDPRHAPDDSLRIADNDDEVRPRTVFSTPRCQVLEQDCG